MSLRPARIYRETPGQPYTRVSQDKSDNYISGAPAPKISIFETGATNKEFEDETHVRLRVEDGCAIRGNALESARIAANSHLRKNVGEENYHLKVTVYPHHVLRHHPLAGVAQADRYYEGMRKPFGRPTGRAAIVDENQAVLLVRLRGVDAQEGRTAMDRAGKKIPVGYRVRME